MPNGQPAQLANLSPFYEPGNKAPRRSKHANRALVKARRHTVEAIDAAIECMRDTEADWHQRMAGVKIILAEGLPKKRDAFDALFSPNGDTFIEVRFVHTRPAVEATPNGNGTFRVEYDAE